MAKSAARKPQARSSQSLVLIISQEGHPLFVEASRIESAETNISIHLLAGDPKQAASIDSLRRSSRGQPIAVAFGTTALWARVVSVKQIVEQGSEVWNLELQPDENANSRSSVFTEYSFNNYSPDYIAELRARRILLDEKLPDALCQRAKMLDDLLHPDGFRVGEEVLGCIGGVYAPALTAPNVRVNQVSTVLIRRGLPALAAITSG